MRISGWSTLPFRRKGLEFIDELWRTGAWPQEPAADPILSTGARLPRLLAAILLVLVGLFSGFAGAGSPVLPGLHQAASHPGLMLAAQNTGSTNTTGAWSARILQYNRHRCSC
jgi:hypothetical protein